MRLFGLFFAVMLFGSAAVAGDEKNLLVNGDLKEGGPDHTLGWVFSKWNLKDGTPEAAASKWGIVKEKGNEENKCLWLATTAAVKAHIWFQQEVKCDSSETYTLTFRAKGSVGAEKKWGGADCGFYLLGADGKWICYQPIKDVGFTSEWKSYTATVTTPEDAVKLGVRVGVGGEGIVFEMFFDDITLVKG